MKDCEITTLNKNTGNPDVNALLTFSGEQDCTAFATVCEAIEDKRLVEEAEKFKARVENDEEYATYLRLKEKFEGKGA